MYAHKHIHIERDRDRDTEKKTERQSEYISKTINEYKKPTKVAFEFILFWSTTAGHVA